MSTIYQDAIFSLAFNHLYPFKLFYASASAFIMPHLKQFASVVVEEPCPSSPLVSPNQQPKTTIPCGTLEPASNEKHLRDIHWVSPAKMVCFLGFGILMSLAHHLYYQSRVGKVVGNEHDQQNEHRSVSNFD
jgi:hypothetical protein